MTTAPAAAFTRDGFAKGSPCDENRLQRPAGTAVLRNRCQAPAAGALELVVAIGDDIRRTQSFRVLAWAQTSADDWRRSFLD